MKKLLFICTANLQRSPTGAEIFKDKYETKSAGVGELTKNPLTSELLEWADVVFVMEDWHREFIAEKFPKLYLKKKIINLDISVREDELPDVYAGRLIVKSGEITRTVDIFIEVKEKRPLFDIKTEVIEKKLISGSDVEARITVFNLGDLRPIDITLYYAIKDFGNNIITFRRESLAIDDELKVTRSFEIPKNLPIGNYIFYSNVSYEGITAASSDSFEIVTVFKKILLILRVFFIYTAILVVIAGSVVMLTRRKVKVKEKAKLEMVKLKETTGEEEFIVFRKGK